MKKIALTLLLVAGAVTVAPKAQADDGYYGERYDHSPRFFRDDRGPRPPYDRDECYAPRRVYYGEEDCPPPPPRHFHPRPGFSFFFGR